MSRLDETIFAKFERSMVRLHSPGRTTGNGFIVYSMSGTHLVMSCEHIMQGVALGSSMPAYFSDKSNETAMLLHVDKVRDLSLLKIADSQHVCTPVEFFAGPTVPEMDVVMLSFFRMVGSHVVRPGTFQGKIVGPPDTRKGPPIAQTPEHECVRSNYVASPGASGSPVFSKSCLWLGCMLAMQTDSRMVFQSPQS
ncbi:hypothetical protein BRADI_4g40954v3 [Brachypodium distachyon]|uniref:Serine protease n=1 Tax=Brachypodium distachyon TaxID=15368 RepID=A0A2K2CTJ6_BRADI|nr:hypothetical protein BRADI_4g40954v3 [Brachypodium distachyon]